MIHVISARGQRSDWFRNIVANPRVAVQIGDRLFSGLAETTCDPARIADLLELRLQRHPCMIGTLLRAESLPPRPSRAQLEDLAAKLAMAAIQPEGEGGE